MPESLRDLDPCLSSLNDRSEDRIDDRIDDLMEPRPKDLAGGHDDRIRSNNSSDELEGGSGLVRLVLLWPLLLLLQLLPIERDSLVFKVNCVVIVVVIVVVVIVFLSVVVVFIASDSRLRRCRLAMTRWTS